jgi:flagella basal body P-ring formation protein FlgA
MIRLAALFSLFASIAFADVIVAARTIPAQSILTPEDLIMRDVTAAGGLTDPSLIIGQEARVALFAGRPIRRSDVGTPAVVERNQLVSLVYSGSGLSIKTDGRALDRAGPGEAIRVMNLASRNMVTAIIDEAGVAHVAR